MEKAPTIKSVTFVDKSVNTSNISNMYSFGLDKLLISLQTDNPDIHIKNNTVSTYMIAKYIIDKYIPLSVKNVIKILQKHILQQEADIQNGTHAKKSLKLTSNDSDIYIANIDNSTYIKKLIGILTKGEYVNSCKSLSYMSVNIKDTTGMEGITTMLEQYLKNIAKLHEDLLIIIPQYCARVSHLIIQ